MAEKRMFSKKIINSAKFLRMPSSTQCLYFHLALNADDDGIVEAFAVMRMVGAAEDDLRILVAKNFIVILNEDLVAYIVDWTTHNTIRRDRKTDSIYTELLLQVIPDADIRQKGKGAKEAEYPVMDCCQMEDECQPNASHVPDTCQPCDSQPPDTCRTNDCQMPAPDKISLDKISLDKNIGITDVIPCEQSSHGGSGEEREQMTGENHDVCKQVADLYSRYCVSYPKIRNLSNSRKKAIRARLKQYSMQDFEKLFRMAEESVFLKGANKNNWSATFDWLICDGNMAKVLDGNYADTGRKTVQPSRSPNRFNNFEQRNTDYNQLLAEHYGYSQNTAVM